MIRYEECSDDSSHPKIVMNSTFSDGELDEIGKESSLKPIKDDDGICFDQYTKLACRIFKVGLYIIILQHVIFKT
ncbi:hypothetical protein EON65_45910 [archaeon]|nr:MAG: hypothetical protein EON65_45910 [archaeon]